MLSPAEKNKIKPELAELEKDRDRCTDSGLRKVIESWIEKAKKRLAEAA
jgi:hypothetical protein